LLQPESEVLFCAKIAQKQAFYEPNWLPNGKNIRQVHLVYHIHLNKGKFRQTGFHENWIHFSARRDNGRKLCGKRTGRLQNPDSVTPHVHCLRAE
jgi:hypothetical protein